MYCHLLYHHLLYHHLFYRHLFYCHPFLSSSFLCHHWIIPKPTRPSLDLRSSSAVRILEDKGSWDVKHTKEGNPIPAKPSVIIMYREDHRFSLDNVLPRSKGGIGRTNANLDYDLIIAR